VKKYSADYIFISPLVSPPFIENGIITVGGGSGKIISAVKSNAENKSVKKTAPFKTLIVPGFINAHTHTDITIKPDSGTPRIFSGWVLSLMKKRKSLGASRKNRLRIKAFKEFVSSGTTLIGDIIEPDSFYDISDISKITSLIPRVKGFIELRGMDPEFAGQRIKEFKNFLRKNSGIFKKTEEYFSAGISPHSIYSVSEDLFKGIIKENSKLGLKTAIHASEHSAEAEFISGRGGDIAENLLPAFNLAGFSKPLKTFPTPVSYLSYLKILNKNTSIIHANEISGEDIEIIKQTGANIIHCPRSNAFFNSKKLPLKKLLDGGITVSIGTDSLYSNKSLSIISELKYAKKIHPDVSSKDLFSAATVNGAKALSFPNVTGTLEPDSYGDFTIFKIRKDGELNEGNIYDRILSFNKTDIMKVVISGNVVYNAD
jgi:5-methylthioadenosine/S-adenosylhomocysteine deaminase